jgi:hypothetical protein
MRKIIVSAIALAVLGLSAPIAAITSADAREVVVIKKRHSDRGHHYGWYKHRHDRGYARGHRDHHGARIIVR